MWGCFLMSGVKILHFLKDWWKSIPIYQNYTMALIIIGCFRNSINFGLQYKSGYLLLCLSPGGKRIMSIACGQTSSIAVLDSGEVRFCFLHQFMPFSISNLTNTPFKFHITKAAVTLHYTPLSINAATLRCAPVAVTPSVGSLHFGECGFNNGARYYIVLSVHTCSSQVHFPSHYSVHPFTLTTALSQTAHFG